VRSTRWVVAFVATLAFVPLAVLLGLQYRSLERLERASEAARRTAADGVLAAVADGVETHYRALASRALDVPRAALTPAALRTAPAAFLAADPREIRGLFAVSYGDDGTQWPVFFAPGRAEPAELPVATERAVIIGTVGWRTFAAKGDPLARPDFHVEERDPRTHLVLRPVVDETSRVVAVVGMVLDERYFADVVLPRTVDAALALFAADPMRPTVVAHANAGAPPEPSPSPQANRTRPPAFVFKDWRLEARAPAPASEALARRQLHMQIALSALLAAAVAAGVLFALQAAARSLRLSQMKSDFVSNVSHELRTPLASIRVFGELLRLGKVDSPEKTRRYGEFIEAESRRLTHLVDNILDLARIESGKKDYRLEPGDLESVARDVVQSLRPGLEQAGFDIDWRPEVAPLPPARIDASAIGQALANLIDNAAKYSSSPPTGTAARKDSEKRIEVAVERRGPEAAIVVTDHGMGIPPHELERIFDRFHRVASGPRHDVAGSGIGLAIVRHVAQAHGGRVEVTSRLGEGSRFRLVVPLLAEGAMPAAPAKSANDAAAEASA
jgi:two-component system phosphate regulon sensor histidine kinase PhoR